MDLGFTANSIFGKCASLGLLCGRFDFRQMIIDLRNETVTELRLFLKLMICDFLRAVATVGANCNYCNYWNCVAILFELQLECEVGRIAYFFLISYFSSLQYQLD